MERRNHGGEVRKLDYRQGRGQSEHFPPTSLTLDSSNPTRTITVTRAGNGTISAESSNTSVATVSVSGTKVTVSGVNQKSGSAVITIKVSAGTNHNAPRE